MAVGAAAALGRAALVQAAIRKGWLWKLALILVGVIVLVPMAFYSAVTHVLRHVAVAPPGRLAMDAYHAAQRCPFATDSDVGNALGAAFLVGSAWVMTSDGGHQFGGYRNPDGDLGHVPADVRPAGPAELAPGGGVHNELKLPAGRTVQPQDWTSVAPLSGEYGVGFLLITPSDWRSWVRDVPASVSRPLDPYRPYDAFVVMACHLRALEQHAGLDVWGAMALWAAPQVLSAVVQHQVSSGPNVRQIIDSIVSGLKQLVSDGVSLGAQFANAVADFMGKGAMGTAALTMGQVQPSATALGEIPSNYLTWIRGAAAAYSIDWTVLAGVMRVEHTFGQGGQVRDPVVNPDSGATGPAQFLPSTWAQWGVDNPIDGQNDAPDITYAPDAILSAARYLQASGAGDPSTLRKALCTYGGVKECMNTTNYADNVMSFARQYRGAVAVAQVTGASSPALQTAVDFAMQQIGKPYVWGGTGPGVYDCSGLVQAAYRAAGISLPRTSQEQWAAGPVQPLGTPHQPGDLVFFVGPNDSPGRPGHVGMAINATQMIVAPEPGDYVKVQTIYSQGYIGATRPAARPIAA